MVTTQRFNNATRLEPRKKTDQDPYTREPLPHRPPDGDALDERRRWDQQHTCGHRGYTGDPLCSARRTLHTGADLLTEKQLDRLTKLFAVEEHVADEATWGMYQRMVVAYRAPDRTDARGQMRSVIAALTTGVPAGLGELRKLDRKLVRRAAEVMDDFDWRGTSNGPIKAVDNRLVHLRDSVLGIRNFTNHIAGSLLETGGLRPDYTLNPEDPFFG